MGEAFSKLAEEDPTFRAHTDQETGQTIIAGMGELHLEIIVDRLLREFKVEANVGAPQVAYKEAFTKPLKLTASMQNSPVDVVSTVTVKLNSSLWIQTVKKHSSLNLPLSAVRFRRNISSRWRRYRRSIKAGILADSLYWVFMLQVYDGSYHEVDSSEMAFHIAGSLAFKDAMKKVIAVLLEPS